MKTNKQDRRSERTHQLLSEALITLLAQQRYVDLTVQDILECANIGRSTFYTHYWDKDDLLTSEIERMVTGLIHHQSNGTAHSTSLLPSLELFQHIQDQYRLYQALVRGQGIDLVMRALRMRLVGYAEQQLRLLSPCPLPAATITVTAQAIVGSLLALLQWWVEAEMPLTPEQLDAHYQRLIVPGLQAVLSR